MSKVHKLGDLMQWDFQLKRVPRSMSPGDPTSTRKRISCPAEFNSQTADDPTKKGETAQDPDKGAVSPSKRERTRIQRVAVDTWYPAHESVVVARLAENTARRNAMLLACCSPRRYRRSQTPKDYRSTPRASNNTTSPL